MVYGILQLKLQKHFNKSYISTEIFPKTMGRKIENCRKIREDSDYDDQFVVRSEKTLEQIQTAEELILLVVEGNYSSGCTVNTALEEIKKTLPNAKIIFATVCIRGKEI